MNERSFASAAWRRLSGARPPSQPQGIGYTLAWYEKLGFLAVFAVLILLRLPEATWHGRLQGEEGTIFLAYAWHRDAWDALWRSFGGYLNLGANASTLLAARLVQGGVLPLEQVPRLTMGVALAFQMLPAALLLWGRANWLTARWGYALSLAMIALAPFSEEVWLNVLHIQFHLTLCCALILVLEPPSSRRGWAAQAAVLLLAPLCGPGAMVLGPLFLARTLFDRSPARLVQTALLGLGSLTQLLVFFTPSPLRGQLMDLPSLAATVFVRIGVLPVTGVTNGLKMGPFVFHLREDQGMAWWLFAGLAIAFCLGLAAAAWHYRRKSAGWLIAGALVLAAVTFGGGMLALGPESWFSPRDAERYNFLPLALLGLAVVAIAQDRAERYRTMARLLCAVMLLSGVSSYVLPIDELARGPEWRSQVERWRQDRDYPLQGWPGSWTIDLSDRSRPCPEARLDTASTLDPSYCESAWLAKVRPR